MRSLMLTMLFLMGFLVLGVSQNEDSTMIKTHKKIIIKTVDPEGNVQTKIFEGDDMKMDSPRPFIITKGRDSIIVEVFVDSMVIDEFEPFEIDKVENFQWNFEEGKDFPGQGRRMMIFGDGQPGFAPLEHQNKAKLGVFIEESPKGVKVTEVEEFSAAYSVGILAGDVITKVNGVKITNVEELQREIGKSKPGDLTEIKVKRNGKNKSFEVRLHGQPKMMKAFNFVPEEGMFPPEMGRFNWQEKHSNCSDRHKGSVCCEGNEFKGRGRGHDFDHKCSEKHDRPSGRDFHDEHKCGDKHNVHSGKTQQGDHKCCSNQAEKKKCNDEQHQHDSCKGKEKK